MDEFDGIDKTYCWFSEIDLLIGLIIKIIIIIVIIKIIFIIYRERLF